MYREAQVEEGAVHPVRAYFGALVIIVLIPGLVIAGWLVYLSVKSERAQIEQGAAQRAREIAAAIDREIVGTQNLLTVLASSHSLHIGDLETFHREAAAVSRQLGIVIVLHDMGRQLVNSAVPWSAPLPGRNPTDLGRTEKEALRTGLPAVSDVFFGPIVKQNMIRVVMSVAKPGQPICFLAIGLPLATFGQMLDRLQADPKRIATIVDRNGIIVARSERHDEFAGTVIKANSPELSPGEEGIKRATNREGIAFHWFYRNSAISGWRISVGVPDRVLEAPSRTAFASFAAAGGLLLAAAIAIGYQLGGRLSQAMELLRTALATARRRGREQFQVLFEAVPGGIVAVDSSGLIAQVNAQIERMFGYRRDELIGRPVEMLLPDRCRAEHVTLRSMFAKSPSARSMGAGRDLFGQRKDGGEFPIEVGLNPITTSAGDLVMATVIDISERKRVEAERDDWRRRIVQGQERERLRLAHELHDRTGQELSAAMLELKGIEAQTNEDGRDRIRRLRQQLDRMGKSLHHVAWELRPASFDELGMASALADYVSDWSERFGIAADFHCRDAKVDDLPEEARTTIYRVVQEALTNVAKHTPEAQSISVVIDRDDSMLRLTVEDDGRGFDPASKAEPGNERRGTGLGHAGMRERVALIGGQVEIESSPGVGTTIFVRIPLTAKEAVA